MAKYQKVENCGPVPYPDRSGRFLVAGETAEGDDWEPFVALGFVVRVDDGAAAPKQAPVPVVEVPPENAAIVTDEAAQGASDGEMQRNDGTGTEELDSSAPGKSGDEGMSGRAATRRRR